MLNKINIRPKLAPNTTAVARATSTNGIAKLSSASRMSTSSTSPPYHPDMRPTVVPTTVPITMTAPARLNDTRAP